MENNGILKQILSEIQTVNGRLAKLEQGQAKLERDVSEIKADISAIKDDIAEIKEYADETRNATNSIAKWVDEAEHAQRLPLPSFIQ